MNSMEKYLIFYYLDKGFYSEVLTLTCSTSSQPEFKLFESLVFVMAAQYVEAIRRLNEINTSEGDVNMATLLLLIFSHKKCMDPDSIVISELESRLKQAQPCSNERSLTLASVCLYFTRHLDKAQGLAEKVLKLNSNCVEARLVTAWVELEKNKTRHGHAANVNVLFRNIISLDPKCINALLGDTATSSSRSERLTKLNRILVQFPHIAPPLIEKMELALASKDWQQCSELCERLLGINEKNSVANKMKVLYLINVAGNYEEAAQLLNSCYPAILQQELPDPCSVLYDWAKPFARICGRDTTILSSTVIYMQHCTKQCPATVAYIEELAFQNYLLGKYEEALRLYRLCLKLDDTSLSLLTGMTMCQFEVARRVMNDQISQQIDLLTEISGKTLSPYIRLIQLTQLQAAQAKATLDSIVQDIMGPLAEKQFGFQYLIDLNVDVLLRVLDEYMKLENSHESCILLLEQITSLLPGLLSGSLLLAYLYICESETPYYDKAKKLLGGIGETRAEYSVAQMMLSLVYIREDDFDRASQHLDLALSTDLKLIETPLYNSLKGLVENKKGRMNESIHALRTARQLHHTKQGSQIQNKSLENPLDLASLKNTILYSLTPCDLCRLYQMLCCNLVKSDQINASSELEKYIAEASVLLKATKYWIDFSIVIAEVKEKTEPKVSLQLLSQVPEHHAKYVQAMERMANVYLTSLKSPEKYISCFRALLDKDPSTENYVRLAQAYLNIQDADKAVMTYEEAKRRNPDARFGVKLARIFVKTHQYEKAIGCYQENGTDEESAVELATLYTKLGQLEPALECLQRLQNLKLTAPVLAKIKEKSHDIKGAYQVLKHALDSCSELQTTSTYRRLADYATQLRDFTSAISYYRKLLVQEMDRSETHAVHIALTRLYMQINDWKSCEALCTQLLNNNSSNDNKDGSTNSGSNATNTSSNNTEVTARLILADATFRRGDFQAASEHFRSLLESTSSGEEVNYTALARYIEIQRRLATLSSVRDDGLLAELTRGAKSGQKPGYHYCQGLLEWYSGNLMKALAQFHKAKYDIEWGTQSIHNMVEICLANPEVVGSTPCGTTALELAQTLIKEMSPSSAEEELSCKLLANFLRCVSQERIDTEMAMNEFTRLAQNEGTRVGASLGLARCYVNQNQASRARNILKLLTKTPWNFEDANYLESCWLLMAELNIQDSRPDRAQDLIHRSLSYNKSSTKSYELLASIAESRELFEDAAGYYKQACRLQGTSDLSLHLKYVSLLLKMKRYAECVDMCLTIHRVNPAIPANLQAYEKALGHLRT